MDVAKLSRGRTGRDDVLRGIRHQRRAGGERPHLDGGGVEDLFAGPGACVGVIYRHGPGRRDRASRQPGAGVYFGYTAAPSA